MCHTIVNDLTMELQKLKPKQLKRRYQWDTAWTLFLSGATLEEVSTMMDIPHRVVVQYSGEHNWLKKRTQALQFAKQATRGDLKRRVEQARNTHTHKMLDQLEHTMHNIEEMPIDNEKNPVERKLNALDRQDLVARRVLGLDKPEQSDPLRDGFMMLAAMGRALVNDDDYIEVETTTETTNSDPAGGPETPQSNDPEGENPSNEGGEEDQIIPLPLPTYSDDSNAPLAPIVRAGNGYPDIPQTPDFHPFAPQEPKIGETGLTQATKPMPDRIIMPEPDDNRTSSDTPSQRDSTLPNGATPSGTARDEPSHPDRDVHPDEEREQTPPDRMRAPASQIVNETTTTPAPANPDPTIRAGVQPTP